MKIRFSIILAVLLASAINGCGEKRDVTGGKIIATVNGEEVYTEDLTRQIAMKMKNNPMFKIEPGTLDKEMELIIDKKLLIQEARRRKLDQTQKFINTIKSFWEQTLIRDLMEYESEKISGNITVTDEEVKEYYNENKAKDPLINNLPLNKVTQDIKGKLLEVKKRKEFRHWLDSVRNNADIKVEKNIVAEDIYEE